MHPYTFRNEDSFLAWTWAQDPFPEMYAFLEREGINGLFTDFTDSAVAVRARLALGSLETLDIPTEPGTPFDFCNSLDTSSAIAMHHHVVAQKAHMHRHLLRHCCTAGRRPALQQHASVAPYRCESYLGH